LQSGRTLTLTAELEIFDEVELGVEEFELGKIEIALEFVEILLEILEEDEILFDIDELDIAELPSLVPLKVVEEIELAEELGLELVFDELLLETELEFELGLEEVEEILETETEVEL
jgi:hypothetical protein